MGDWIYSKGPSGEYGYINLKTGLFRSSRPLEGTIQRTAENSVGYKLGTQRGRILAAAKMADSYNSRLKQVHNYLDTTNKLQQKQLSVTVDSNGDAHVVLTDYTPVNEAPMQITGPEKWLVETEAVPFKPLQMGTAYLAGRFGSGAILNWGRKTVLNDAFSKFGSEIPVSGTGKDLLTPYLKAKEATGSDDLYHIITNDKINFNTGMLEGVNGLLWWNPSRPWNTYESRFSKFPVIIGRKTAPIIGSEDRNGIVKDMSKLFIITSDIPLTQVRRPLGFNKVLEYRTSPSEPVSGNTTTILLLPRQIGTRPVSSETSVLRGNTINLDPSSANNSTTFIPLNKKGGYIKLISKGRGGFALPTKDQVINFYNLYKNNWGDMDLRLLSGLLGNLWVESLFNPNVVNGKYQGYALQDRKSSLYTRAKYGWTPVGQILGILDYGYGRMPKKYSGTSGYLMGNYLNYHKHNPNYTPADSSDYWRLTFERSNNKIKERRNSANTIYRYLSSYLKSTPQDNSLLHNTTDLL